MASNKFIPISVASGDGIGPEIMEAVLGIFTAAQVPLHYEFVEMGKAVFLAGHSTGMTDPAKTSIEKNGILFKGPMETPKGSGMKSINVTARKVWNTYANKRVFRTLLGVETVFSKAGIPINITIVRENIEDTYGGIEHMLTPDVALCRRLITRPGSLQLHRYAFEMASRKGSKKILCGHKANIMKLTDGLFLECFYEIAKEYPHLEASDLIVDDLAMRLVVRPEQFDVVVLPNLQGDIISDLCAGLVGGLGFAPSANIGQNISIFEAVHGTAPDIAGKNMANPTALLLSGCMLLRHLQLAEQAAAIENALLYTLEMGAHTADFGHARGAVLSTSDFAAEIAKNLGCKPASMSPAVGENTGKKFAALAKPKQYRMMTERKAKTSQIKGVDFFIESEAPGVDIAEIFAKICPKDYWVTTISNRGTQVWPVGSVFTDSVNQYRVRVETTLSDGMRQVDAIALASKVIYKFKLCSLEFLMSYDGKPAYSLAQGQ